MLITNNSSQCYSVAPSRRLRSSYMYAKSDIALVFVGVVEVQDLFGAHDTRLGPMNTALHLWLGDPGAVGGRIRRLAARVRFQ